MESSLSPSPAVSVATAQLIEASLDSADVRLSVMTTSMSPALRPGDHVLVRKIRGDQPHIGDIVVIKWERNLVVHRLIARRQERGSSVLITKGDNCPAADSPWLPSALIGVVAAMVTRRGEKSCETARSKAMNRCIALLSYGQWMMMCAGHTIAGRIVGKGLRFGLRTLAALLSALLVMLVVVSVPDASAAVKISSFTAKATGNQILVSWRTGSEINNVGFNLMRSSSQNGTYSKLNAAIIPSQCLGCLIGSNYSYTDASASLGQTYFYKLQSVDTSGHGEDFGPVSASIAAPTATFTSTSTKTPTRVPTATPSASLPPNTATATRMAAAGLPSPILLPTVIRPTATLPAASMPGRTAQVSAPASATPSAAPPTKIAYAVGRPSPAPSAPANLPDVKPLPTEEAGPVAGEMAIPDEANPDDVPVDQSVAVDSGRSAAIPYVAFALSSLLGCGSFLSGLLAIVLLVRHPGHL